MLTFLKNATNYSWSIPYPVVFLELQRNGEEVYYYMGKHECDFLLKKGETITSAIQVCFSLTEENKNREVEGLLNALDDFRLGEGIVITEDLEVTESHGEKNIKFVPLWKWLLENKPLYPPSANPYTS